MNLTQRLDIARQCLDLMAYAGISAIDRTPSVQLRNALPLCEEAGAPKELAPWADDTFEAIHTTDDGMRVHGLVYERGTSGYAWATECAA
ncbi:MAG: hypothetical protein GY788_21195 [bacterium]|nr:hypothetical protein [bacterium]